MTSRRHHQPHMECECGKYNSAHYVAGSAYYNQLCVESKSVDVRGKRCRCLSNPDHPNFPEWNCTSCKDFRCVTQGIQMEHSKEKGAREYEQKLRGLVYEYLPTVLVDIVLDYHKPLNRYCFLPVLSHPFTHELAVSQNVVRVTSSSIKTEQLVRALPTSACLVVDDDTGIGFGNGKGFGHNPAILGSTSSFDDKQVEARSLDPQLICEQQKQVLQLAADMMWPKPDSTSNVEMDSCDASVSSCSNSESAVHVDQIHQLPATPQTSVPGWELHFASTSADCFSKYGGNSHFQSIEELQPLDPTSRLLRCDGCGRKLRLYRQFRTRGLPEQYAELISVSRACGSESSHSNDTNTEDHMWQWFECPDMLCTNEGQGSAFEIRVVDMISRHTIFASWIDRSPRVALCDFPPQLAKDPFPEQLVLGWLRRVDAPNELYNESIHEAPTTIDGKPLEVFSPCRGDKFLGFPCRPLSGKPPFLECTQCLEEMAARITFRNLLLKREFANRDVGAAKKGSTASRTFAAIDSASVKAELKLWDFDKKETIQEARQAVGLQIDQAEILPFLSLMKEQLGFAEYHVAVDDCLSLVRHFLEEQPMEFLFQFTYHGCASNLFQCRKHRNQIVIRYR